MCTTHAATHTVNARRNSIIWYGNAYRAHRKFVNRLREVELCVISLEIVIINLRKPMDAWHGPHAYRAKEQRQMRKIAGGRTLAREQRTKHRAAGHTLYFMTWNGLLKRWIFSTNMLLLLESEYLILLDFLFLCYFCQFYNNAAAFIAFLSSKRSELEDLTAL